MVFIVGFEFKIFDNEQEAQIYSTSVIDDGANYYYYIETKNVVLRSTDIPNITKQLASKEALNERERSQVMQ